MRVVSILFWRPRFACVFSVFTPLFLVIRQWAARTAQVPLDDESEMLLNRVYPLRRQALAAGPSLAPGAAEDRAEVERLAERAAL